MKHSFQRVAIFIDTQNMYHSAKHLFGARVNFGAVVEAALAGRQLIRAVAYVAKSKTGEEDAFFDALTKSGIELKVKDVQEFASGAKKADWDVGMAVDAMAMAPRVDAVVLVTGDGDFVPLVEYLKANGVLAEVVAFEESTNARLKETASTFTNLSAEATHVLMHSRARRPGADAETPEIAPAHHEPAPDAPATPRRSGKTASGGRKVKITF